MPQKPVPVLFLTIVVGFLIAVGCGRLGSNNSNSTSNSGTKLSADSLKTSPKDSIAYQFELLKAGDVENLKRCFTERLRDRITPEVVEKGKSEANRYTLDDLVASVEMGEDEGDKTAKIMMKNGRTLTMLVQTDGEWLADTVWFK